MSDTGRLDHALDRLCADRSPRHEAAALTPLEVSMLIVAQRLRGTIPPPPSPQFIAGLLAMLFPDTETRSRVQWFSSAETSQE